MYSYGYMVFLPFETFCRQNRMYIENLIQKHIERRTPP